MLAIRAIHRLNLDLFPDVVHAHSSIAGALVRMTSLDRTRVVYSPHCFAFERRDTGWLQRKAVERVERALVRRTDLLLAVAPNEIDLAAELGHRVIAYAPNRTPNMIAKVATHKPVLKVVTVGRVCHQKDWRYFVHLKKYVDEHLNVEASWHWLGGGDAEGEQALVEAGVSVSGWISREELVGHMADAQVYVHTAAWEAAPISILEACSLGLPLVLRSIPPLDSLDLPGRETSVVGLAHRISSLARPAAWHRAQAESIDAMGQHSLDLQGTRLRQAYGRAVGTKTVGDISHVANPDILAAIGPGAPGAERVGAAPALAREAGSSR